MIDVADDTKLPEVFVSKDWLLNKLGKIVGASLYRVNTIETIFNNLTIFKDEVV